MVSYVPEIEIGSKGNRTEDQRHLQGGTLLSVNDSYKVVGERLPWRPVVKTSPFNAGSVGSIPGREVKILHASGLKNQDIRQKQYCNKFNEDFLNGPHFF